MTALLLLLYANPWKWLAALLLLAVWPLPRATLLALLSRLSPWRARLEGTDEEVAEAFAAGVRSGRIRVIRWPSLAGAFHASRTCYWAYHCWPPVVGHVDDCGGAMGGEFPELVFGLRWMNYGDPLAWEVLAAMEGRR